jgi:hypothetical protein
MTSACGARDYERALVNERRLVEEFAYGRFTPKANVRLWRNVGRFGPVGDIAGPNTQPADCGDCDNNFSAGAQIWYRFHGDRKN